MPPRSSPLAVIPTLAADKAFKRSDLDDAAIKLEAQIKSDAGTVTKPAATLRRDADAAFQKNDFRTGMTVLGQLVTVAPTDATSWLRLSRAVLQIRPRDDNERALLLDRASTAAYIAYSRASDRNLEADSLALLGKTFADRKQWRPALDSMRLALDLRESADLRGQYERLRGEYGFRLLDYSVDSDAISPRACFQFSEELPGRRTDFSPYVAVAGQDKPAISANDKQLCVEGLKHGERYADHAARRPAVGGAGRRWRNRPTSPSSCATASRSCAFPARPMCCRAAASAAFRCSASTPARSCSRSIASATAI